MDRNLAKRDVYEKDKKIARDRGPIIPSRSLHSSAYFSVTNKGAESKQNNIRFNEIGDQPKYIYAGRFNTSNFRFAHVGKDLLEKHVTNFLVAVGENCICELHADGGEFNFNSAILLPLFRPAALFKGERQNIFNGGGMFLFGNIEQPEIESDFVLGLQTNLIKSIFKASHAQIHFDEIDAFKNIFTAMLIHQIKNKLTNQITQEIVELLRRNHLDPAVISTLNEVKISSMNIVKKFSTHLNNLGLKLSQTDIPEIDFAKLERITNELKAKCNLEIQLINEQPAVNAMMKVNPDILEAILDQLIENALKYYKENHIDDRNEKIIVKWEVDPAENIIQISVKSTNTVMEKETLDNYGINPIRDTGSTGLGGLFINNILEQIDAKIFGDGRYFQPLNENEGFCLNIKFNLYNQKNDN